MSPIMSPIMIGNLRKATQQLRIKNGFMAASHFWALGLYRLKAYKKVKL
jgi:hypothetical protein